jgi:hypothetical protein
MERMLATNKKDICPEVGVRVLFLAATAFARNIEKKDKVIVLTGSHRGQLAKMDKGWIIIEQEWFAK